MMNYIQKMGQRNDLDVMFIWFRWLKMNYPMIIRQSCHYDFLIVVSQILGQILFGSVGEKVSGIVFHFGHAIHFLVFVPVRISAHLAISLNFTIFFSFPSPVPCLPSRPRDWDRLVTPSLADCEIRNCERVPFHILDAKNVRVGRRHSGIFANVKSES